MRFLSFTNSSKQGDTISRLVDYKERHATLGLLISCQNLPMKLYNLRYFTYEFTFISEHLKHATMLSLIDEESFADLCDLYANPYLYLHNPQEEEQSLVDRGMSKNLAPSFRDDINKGRKFEENLGPKDLASAIDKLSIESRSKELRRLVHRLEKKVDKDLEDLHINLPNGESSTFTLTWFKLPEISAPDEHKLPIGTKIVYEAFTLRLLPGPEDHPEELDGDFIVIPLGTFGYDDSHEYWNVVRVVDKAEYWVIFDYYSVESDDKAYLDPKDRKGRLGKEMSVGRLSGLFDK